MSARQHCGPNVRGKKQQLAQEAKQLPIYRNLSEQEWATKLKHLTYYDLCALLGRVPEPKEENDCDDEKCVYRERKSAKYPHVYPRAHLIAKYKERLSQGVNFPRELGPAYKAVLTPHELGRIPYRQLCKYAGVRYEESEDDRDDEEKEREKEKANEKRRKKSVLPKSKTKSVRKSAPKRCPIPKELIPIVRENKSLKKKLKKLIKSARRLVQSSRNEPYLREVPKGKSSDDLAALLGGGLAQKPKSTSSGLAKQHMSSSDKLAALLGGGLAKPRTSSSDDLAALLGGGLAGGSRDAKLSPQLPAPPRSISSERYKGLQTATPTSESSFVDIMN